MFLKQKEQFQNNLKCTGNLMITGVSLELLSKIFVNNILYWYIPILVSTSNLLSILYLSVSIFFLSLFLSFFPFLFYIFSIISSYLWTYLFACLLNSTTNRSVGVNKRKKKKKEQECCNW